MIKFLINLIVLILPFSELVRIAILPNFFLRGLDLLVLLLLSFLLITKPLKLAYFRPFIFFGSVLILSFLLNKFNFNSLAYLIRTLIYLTMLPYFISSVQLFFPERHFNFSLLIFILLGLVQYFFYPELRNLYYLGYDPHHYRWFGLFLDPNISGLILGWSFFYYQNQKNRLAKPLMILALISLLLTYSRISWLCFLAMLLYKNWGRGRYKRWLYFLGLMGVGIFLLPRYFGEGTNLWRTNSIKAKAESAILVFEQIKKKPILGIGFNNTHLLKNKSNEPITNNSLYGIDNSLFTVVLTSGLLGLATYLGLLKYLWQSNSDKMKLFSLGFFIHALSVNSFFIPSVFVYYLFFLLSQHK